MENTLPGINTELVDLFQEIHDDWKNTKGEELYISCPQEDTTLQFIYDTASVFGGSYVPITYVTFLYTITNGIEVDGFHIFGTLPGESPDGYGAEGFLEANLRRWNENPGLQKYVLFGYDDSYALAFDKEENTCVLLTYPDYQFHKKYDRWDDMVYELLKCHTPGKK